MPNLFPQLLAETGKRLAVELSALTPEEAERRADQRSEDPSSNSVFSATGGTVVNSAQLTDLRKEILARARDAGYPTQNRSANLKCDTEIAIILRDRMNITAHEAASDGIWEYLSCVLMPDVVVWRFRDNHGRTSPERLLAGRRNNFQRLWWRAHVVAGHLGAEEATKLLAFLTEDDAVATLERPGLFGNLRLMRTYYWEFRKIVEANELGAPREAVNRDVHKRLLRIVAIRSVESLANHELQAELREIISESAAQVRRSLAAAGR